MIEFVQECLEQPFTLAVVALFTYLAICLPAYWRERRYERRRTTHLHHAS